jgi:hypothetical protein
MATTTSDSQDPKPPWDSIEEYDMADVLKWREDHPFPQFCNAMLVKDIFDAIDDEEFFMTGPIDEVTTAIANQIMHVSYENPCCDDRSPHHMAVSYGQVAFIMGIQVGARGKYLEGLTTTPVEPGDMVEKYETAAIDFAKWKKWSEGEAEKKVIHLREKFGNSDHPGVILVRSKEEMDEVISVLQGAPQAKEGGNEEPHTGMYL